MYAEDVLKIIGLRNIITFQDYYTFAKNNNIILINISHFSHFETYLLYTDEILKNKKIIYYSPD